MAKKSSDAKARKRETQQKVLEFLAETGNISYSCKRAGISRETYYEWREERPFAYDADAAIGFGKGFVNDLAHNQLVRSIQEGNMAAVRFQLEKCHPDYQPRKPKRPQEDLTPITAVRIEVVDPEKMPEKE